MQPTTYDHVEPALADIAVLDLRQRIEQLSHDALDRLPFGVIRLDSSGRVTYFSRTEGAQSGYGDRPALGRLFFHEVAPCMAHPDFLQRLEQAIAAGTVDITFEQIGDFADAERELTVRVLSASTGGLWVALQRNP